MSDLTPSIVSSCPPSPRATPKRPPRPRPASATSARECTKTNDLIKRPKKRACSASVSSASARDAAADTGMSILKREPIDLPRRKRVTSAVDSRVMTVSASDNQWASKKWGQTSYSIHYTPKKPIVRSKPRPCSATRMHNPHPSQMFLKWRIPTRIHPHPRAVQVNPSILKDIREKFYEDYLADENKTGGAVPITNVAKIPFPGNNPAIASLKVTGSRLPLTQKKTAETENYTQMQQELILQRALNPASYQVYQDWVQGASEDEKHILAKMLKATNVESSKVKKALSEVFTKESLKYIKEWMHGADENELTLAINVIEQLSKKVQHTSTRNSSRYSKKLYRSRTWPKKETQPTQYDFDIRGKKLGRPHSADTCSECSQKDTGMIYNKIISNKLKPSLVPSQTVLWHHKVKPPIVPRLLNRGSVFNLPHQPHGQHYALHPEWPIA